MAIKGLSIPVFGKYNYDKETGTVSYSDGMINPHAISYSVTVQSTSSNPLYGCNRVIENDNPRFDSGTAKLETDELIQEVSKFLLGLHEVERTYGEGKTVQVLVYDDSQKAPELGLGIIEEHQRDDVDFYKAVILKRVQFNIPEDAATTRKGSIEWQTKTIEGTIMRSEEVSDTAKYPWKEEATFDSESEALEFLKLSLGVTASQSKEQEGNQE